MSDQTFHTPSFGDEEFDIPAINPQQQQSQQQSQQQNQQQQGQQQPQQPPHGARDQQQSMQNYQQQHHASMGQQQGGGQDQSGMGMHDPRGGFQQPLYLPSGPDHGMVTPSYHSPTGYQPQPPQGNQLLMIQQQQMMMAHGQQQSMGQYGASPPRHQPAGRGNSPPAQPGQEPTTSEDSDDSTPHPAMITAMKRPSPEPADQALTKAQKKPKVQKKKKKRDPNEPQKPVSAYALFFRDTQAAIKGQNPNASFGEVSKIVASMWDALNSEHKNVYKKKTEAAKKEYLKALAAYRASLVSKGAGDTEGMYGNYGGYGGNAGSQYGGYQPQGAIPSPPMSSAPTPPAAQQQPQQSPIGKKPMMGGPPTQQQQQQHMMQGPMGPVHGHMNMQHMQQQQHGGYMQQVPSQQQQQQHMPVSPQQQQQHSHMAPPQQQHMSPPPMVSSSPPVSSPSSVPASAQQSQQMGGPPQTCLRHGCPNRGVTNPEWEDEYCSNECVVSHCRDVFNNWVATNKSQSQSFSTVK